MLLVFLGVKYLLALKRYAGKVNTDCINPKKLKIRIINRSTFIFPVKRF
jgi:hypothetical protein